MTNALRPSELFALKWKCFDSKVSTMSVTETAYKGKIRSWGKTRKSLATIHIPGSLAADLEARRAKCPNPSPDAYIFANQDGSFLDTDNYRKRVLHKLAEEMGLPKLTFQVIRRTIATLAKNKGHVKDIQGMMRHSRLATTAEVYMQSLEDGVRSTVNSIYDELSGTGTWGSGPTSTPRIGRQRPEQKSVPTHSAKEIPEARRQDHPAKRVRGVVLEFATRLRQSREGRELLND